MKINLIMDKSYFIIYFMNKFLAFSRLQSHFKGNAMHASASMV